MVKKKRPTERASETARGEGVENGAGTTEISMVYISKRIAVGNELMLTGERGDV